MLKRRWTLLDILPAIAVALILFVFLSIVFPSLHTAAPKLITEAISSSNFYVALFTGLLAIIAFQQRSIIARQVNSLEAAERAYVRMSHTSPGINPTNRKVQIEIKNVGRTPADVMGVRLGPLVVDAGERLPSPPPYSLTENMLAAQSFVASGDYFFVRHGIPISDSDWVAIQARQKDLYIFGLVEYVDRFGKWHRAGYARRYAPDREPNNLAFVGLSGTYTYDIEILSSDRLTRD